MPAAQPIIARDAAKATGASRRLLHEVATSELVWPSPADYRRLYNYADVSGKLQAAYESIFNPVIAARLRPAAGVPRPGAAAGCGGRPRP